MKSILSVDDSPAILKMVERYIRDLDYNFIGADNGKNALNLVEHHYQDIVAIALDWHMPVLDGLETLKLLKKNELYRDIPVIMVTTEGQKDNVIEAIKEGAADYLFKPFTKESFQAKLVYWIEMNH